jgi:hypothetical protein
MKSKKAEIQKQFEKQHIFLWILDGFWPIFKIFYYGKVVTKDFNGKAIVFTIKFLLMCSKHCVIVLLDA